LQILVVPAIDWLAGPENRLHRIFHRLAKKHSVHCIYLDTGEKVRRQESLVTLHRPKIVKTSNLALFQGLNFLPQYNLVRKLLVQEQIDVLVTSNVLGGSAAIFAAKRNGIPSVYDYVDYMPFFANHLSLPGIIKKSIRVVLEKSNEFNIQNADLVLAIGLLLYRHARKLNPSVMYLPNGVDVRRFAQTDEGAKIKRKFELDGTVIGYVGYIQFWTNFQPVLHGFIEVLKTHPKTKMLIIGIGPKLQKLKVLIRELGLENNIVLTGYVDYSQLPVFMSAVDIFILPFEPSFATHAINPLKIHEYAAMAKPTVTTPLYEIQKSYKDAVLTAQTAKEYSDAFLRLINSPNLRKRMGTVARRIVEQKFDWDKIASQYEEHLAQLVEMKKH
jgi:glycosyltransferase involved in cell wall biosynthesis